MKRITKRRLLQFTWGALTVLMISLIGGLFAPSYSQTTEVLSACVPEGVVRTEPVTAVSEKGIQYRLLDAYTEKASLPFSLLVSLQGESCQILLSNPMNDFYPYHRVVPLQVARQLALGELRYSINKLGGMDKFRATLQPRSEGSSWEFAEEDIWALQHVGITLPKNIKVVRAK
ncbi:hypothetical protein [Iningainema tapete]|uniref:Uncharacterized protein n=1 Tax=Iningainema tapete BLCC-T55 TaxID=2748662 RepID=A0A8J6XJG0_9CYAN|nr:hypothetical protein [Iningainema tapete]MBD2772609.1 hypothetical protein [Iningainema tapete BLCC-T55]